MAGEDSNKQIKKVKRTIHENDARIKTLKQEIIATQDEVLLLRAQLKKDSVSFGMITDLAGMDREGLKRILATAGNAEVIKTLRATLMNAVKCLDEITPVSTDETKHTIKASRDWHTVAATIADEIVNNITTDRSLAALLQLGNDSYEKTYKKEVKQNIQDAETGTEE